MTRIITTDYGNDQHIHVLEAVENSEECDICLQKFFGKYAEFEECNGNYKIVHSVIVCKECMEKIADKINE